MYFNLKVHHNVISKYLPKLYHYEYEFMKLGNILAVLDNNYNAGREQKTTVKTRGNKTIIKQAYRIAYRKPTKKVIPRKFYEPKSYGYLNDMVKKSRSYVAAGHKNISTPLKKRLAPTERYSRNKLIRLSIQRSRFQHS